MRYIWINKMYFTWRAHLKKSNVNVKRLRSKIERLINEKITLNNVGETIFYEGTDDLLIFQFSVEMKNKTWEECIYHFLDLTFKLSEQWIISGNIKKHIVGSSQYESKLKDIESINFECRKSDTVHYD